ncbi:Peptidase C12 domain containing protein [Trichuris trichiura]|uniref:Ubiquitin carboxyl-terminal hydrolase n=1 Tax=Trichuris trichiura TaxID=36087 RepID=A0A077Z209_TRITR|nr:Peptidase C12 domain containing protein [Trichuris trichiura]
MPAVGTSADSSKEDCWPPLESNPQVFNRLIWKLANNQFLECYDIVSFDPQDLTYLPSEVVAVLLLFPVTEKYEKTCCEMQACSLAGQSEFPKDLFFVKQTVKNACGMVALLHALGNNPSLLRHPSFVADFLKISKDSTPEQRGALMASSAELITLQSFAAKLGQSRVIYWVFNLAYPSAFPLQAIDAQEDVFHHFVCFVKGSDGKLYELDGRKTSPLCHGPTAKSTFLSDALEQCRQFPQRCGEDVNYNAIAICAMAE